MGNGKRQREARVFIDVTTPVRLAHSRQVGQTQGLTGAIDTRTDVFSESREQRCMKHAECQRNTHKTLLEKAGY